MEFRKPNEYQPGEVLIPAEKIQSRLAELAPEIARKYYEQNLLVIGLLKGAFVLTADLVRALYKAGLTDLEVDFMTVESYGNETNSSHDVRIAKDTRTDPCQRKVLLIDDIIDSTFSLLRTHEHIQKRGAQSVETLALIAKPERYETPYRANHVGFCIPKIWIEGYGMDSYQLRRGSPDIIVGPTVKR